MSAADDPASTGLWKDFLIAARSVIEDSGLLSQADGDRLAEAVTKRLLGDFLAMAEADSKIVFGAEGNGPFCSWCHRLPGPRLPETHFQYGAFCDCKRKEEPANSEDGKAAA